MTAALDATAERYLAKVDRSEGPDACWPWTSVIKDKRYGVFWAGKDSPRVTRSWSTGPTTPAREVPKRGSLANTGYPLAMSAPCCGGLSEPGLPE